MASIPTTSFAAPCVAGSPQVNFAIEQLVEIAAGELGMDGISFAVSTWCVRVPHVTGRVLDTHVVSLQEVMDKVLDKIDYHNKRARCSFGDPAQDKWYGIGLAISYRGMSLGAEEWTSTAP